MVSSLPGSPDLLPSNQVRASPLPASPHSFPVPYCSPFPNVLIILPRKLSASERICQGGGHVGGGVPTMLYEHNGALSGPGWCRSRRDDFSNICALYALTFFFTLFFHLLNSLILDGILPICVMSGVLRQGLGVRQDAGSFAFHLPPVAVPAITSPPPSFHTLIIHHYYHMAGYAIPPHSFLVADNDSNSSQSA